MSDRLLNRRLRSRWRFLHPREPSASTLRHARIPKEFRGARLSLIPDGLEHKDILLGYAGAAEASSREGIGLLLHGPHGHGKTGAACALARVFLAHDVPALFVRWNELGRVFHSWDPECAELRERIMWIRALVIDDVGERISQDFDKTRSAFVEIVRQRYDEKLPVFMTLNGTDEDFLAEFDSQSTILCSPRYLFTEVRGKNWREDL